MTNNLLMSYLSYSRENQRLYRYILENSSDNERALSYLICRDFENNRSRFYNRNRPGNTYRPVRNFYPLKKLGFLCVVNKDKVNTWQDLDGKPITIHARGSGTEAISYYMEKVHNIKFSEMSFVPGSEVRGVALMKGTIDATF